LGDSSGDEADGSMSESRVSELPESRQSCKLQNQPLRFALAV